jgi:hypothetical protein
MHEHTPEFRSQSSNPLSLIEFQHKRGDFGINYSVGAVTPGLPKPIFKFSVLRLVFKDFFHSSVTF